MPGNSFVAFFKKIGNKMSVNSPYISSQIYNNIQLVILANQSLKMVPDNTVSNASLAENTLQFIAAFYAILRTDTANQEKVMSAVQCLLSLSLITLQIIMDIENDTCNGESVLGICKAYLIFQSIYAVLSPVVSGVTVFSAPNSSSNISRGPTSIV